MCRTLPVNHQDEQCLGAACNLEVRDGKASIALRSSAVLLGLSKSQATLTGTGGNHKSLPS